MGQWRRVTGPRWAGLQRWALIAAFAGASPALPTAWAQVAGVAAPPAAALNSDRIAGRVVSTLDGHPLGGATVLIADVRTGRTAQTVLAGEDGAFVFTGVLPGKYSLQGVAPGYLADFYDAHEQFSTAIVTGAGYATDSLVLRLPPGASISGHVTDEAGEPVRGAVLKLYRETHGEGTSRVTAFRAAVADDLGEYEIGSLPPGNYFVSASGVPWYAVHPQTHTASEGDGVIASVDPSLNVAYPATFYPGATDSDGATPIPVKAGDRVSIDLRLAPQPALRLTVHLSGDAQKGFAMPQLMKQVFDDVEPIEAPAQIVGSDAEVNGIPPGRYQLRQVDPRTGGTAKTTVVDLTSRAVEVSAAEGEDPGEVSITVRDAGGAKLPRQMQVQLMGKERGIAAGQIVNEKDEAEFTGVKPGEYYLQVFGGERLYHVLRLSADGRELPDRTLHVSAGTRLRLVANVAAGAIAVEGTAKRNGRPAAGAMIMLVPQDPDHNVELFRRDQSDQDGTFLLPNVTPGAYTVLAIANGWTLEWGRADVLTRYLEKGVPLTVPAIGKTSVRLTEPIVVQPR